MTAPGHPDEPAPAPADPTPGPAPVPVLELLPLAGVSCTVDGHCD